MSQFLRLLNETDKGRALASTCTRLRRGEADPRHFDVEPESFDAVPGKPFAYWVSEAVRGLFRSLPALENSERTARQGLATAEDFRFLRTWWESTGDGWVGFAKGGNYSPFFSEIDLVVNWAAGGAQIKAGICQRYPYLNGNAEFVAKNPQFYFRSGISYPPTALGYDRKGLGMYVLPGGCIFGHKACSIFVSNDQHEELLALLALLSSKAVDNLFRVLAQSRSWEVGHLQKIPVPDLERRQREPLSVFAKRTWLLRRRLCTVSETSHAFLLPAALRARLGDYDRPAIEVELARIQVEIDSMAFDLYGFAVADREVAMGHTSTDEADDAELNDDDEEDSEPEAPATDAMLSWAVGVAFGRFDWRLATGERLAPPEPDTFDPLPVKSPGMVPDGTAPFHACAGILVDDPGHPHDLARLVEEVLTCVDAPVPHGVRRWLQRDFFAFHLQRYSKSRRKAPIYWPLSTPSGSYALWVYSPDLSSQTLYTALNDFVEPKLKHVGADVATLRSKGSARTLDDERQFDALQEFELELMVLRDTLLKLAPIYKPNHDDGVQISAAPLWPLFRHKPWQKVLKDTWTKLEKGDYDWAHLAMNYWPERVREKCKTDKSLAIAHGSEDLYVEPEINSRKKTRSNKKDRA